ncbi:MAG: 16S rRNA (cytidine(1402)-2'-O)-methyltransferase [Clostridia bacterium]|jgi:16S rRNA (cytidine1402-2'-O)-methyltransferase|nr:16S rRNA (cytidine(1402)-2'-O)-methyltransferase [Clostridia bacterium]
MKGTIYLVATPIGNLLDMTFRAIQTLKEVDLIAAEDTRHTLQLLNYFEISKPMISYHRHNEEIKTEELINEVIAGKNIAIVTDAGTPGISDPGEEIVKAAIKEEIEIVPIPGACALINSLIVSGISTKEFSFYGFLPLNKKNRKETFSKIAKETKTVILYEAPHKLQKTLEDILQAIGDVPICIVRELTKIHEEKIYGKVSEVIQKYKEPKGEFVIILDLNANEDKEEMDFEQMTLQEHYMFYEKLGLEKKEIIKQIAKDRNVPKNEIYQQFLNS